MMILQSHRTLCVYMMLSQWPISCASEMFQVPSLVFSQQSLFNYFCSPFLDTATYKVEQLVYWDQFKYNLHVSCYQILYNQNGVSYTNFWNVCATCNCVKYMCHQKELISTKLTSRITGTKFKSTLYRGNLTVQSHFTISFSRMQLTYGQVLQ